MPSIQGKALIKGLTKMLIKPPYNVLTAPMLQMGSKYARLTG